jgi:hypothetical protein
MKMIAITSTAILSLILGVAVPASAQHEEHGDKQDHGKQQQGGHQQGKSEQQHAQPQGQQRQQQTQRDQQQPQHNQQQHAQQQRQEQNDHQQHAQQQRQDQNDRYTRSAQGRGNDRRQYSPQQRRVQRSAWQQHRSQNWQSDHRNWQQRGGYRGYRVPEYRYRGYFGPGHGFRIGGLPFLVVGGYPRFQYQGYWISAVDPWPSGWGDDWYDNDDVYVSYEDNGYYMYNRSYPGQGIAINITF